MKSYKQTFEEYIESLKEKIQDQIRDAIQKGGKDFLILYKSKIETMFKEVIDDFYSGYEPKFYTPKNGGGRKKRLYKLLNIVIGNDYIQLSFDESQLLYRDGSGGGENHLYQTVFRKGYHGGAETGNGIGGSHPNPGVAYWRRPVPGYWRWGQPAKKEKISPLDAFNMKLDEYEETQMQKDYDNACSKYVKKIKI